MAPFKTFSVKLAPFSVDTLAGLRQMGSDAETKLKQLSEHAEQFKWISPKLGSEIDDLCLEEMQMICICNLFS